MDTALICVYDVYRIYNSRMNSKELIKALEKEGWVLRSSKGSHYVFNHPRKAGHITVPHPKKDLGIGLVQKLLKQARIK
jgi:predicted RNA binding protein YcfA (HicA-like mRNA interferase family)